jgi:transcription-repair coupling factor (superfamily II helicase)
LARIAELPALDSFEEELGDRFGELPEEAQRLLSAARVRVLARNLGVARIDAGPAGIALAPRPEARLDPASAGLEEKNGRLLESGRWDEAGERLARVETLLLDLA